MTGTTGATTAVGVSDGGGDEVSRRPAASASEWTAKEPAWSDEERGGGGESEETDGWDGSNEDAAADGF